MDRLRVAHLEVRYGDLVGVADVSLDVPPGTIVALLGSNGAGKTTTLNAIAGLVPPERRHDRMARRGDHAAAGLRDRQQGAGAVAGGLAAVRRRRRWSRTCGSARRR